MKVAIIGGGIAGLGAAWEIVRAGHQAVVFERESEVGGRCRTFQWHDEWRIRGAAAFIASEKNLVELATQLGIYDPGEVVDVLAGHSWTMHRRGRSPVSLPDFTPARVLACTAMPLCEKLALAATIPMLMRQTLRNRRHDPTSAVALDTISACDYFRRYSPFFADYMLEPVMQTFCGYGSDDFSLAWLAWLMTGPYAWAKGWWLFRDRGVGKLTQALGAALDGHRHGTVIAGATVLDVAEAETAVTVRWRGDGAAVEQAAFDAAIVAVPGSTVPMIVSTLTPDERAFFQAVEYVGHHICYALLRLPEQTEPVRRVLPTVEGFRYVSNFNLKRHHRPGEYLLYLEVKGEACRDLATAADAEIISRCLADVAVVEPAVAGAPVLDSYVQRNDLALCRRHVGYTRQLERYTATRRRGRIDYAGDYLISSSVGQAHYSGLQAAHRILGAASPR